MRIVLACLAFFVLTTTYHYNTHSDGILRKELETDVRIFSYQLNNIMSRIKTVAGNATEHLELSGWEKRDSAFLQTFLQHRLEAIQNASILALFDKDGNKLALSTKDQGPKISITDREYYRQLKSGADGVWDGPIKNRVDGTYSYVYAKSVRRNGELVAIMVVALTTAQIESICAQTVTHATHAVLSKSSGLILTGCGISLPSPGSATIADVFPDIDLTLLNGSTIKAGSSIYVVKRLKENPDLLVVGSAGLKEFWRDVYHDLVSELIIFALSMLVFVVKLPAKMRFRNT